MITAQTHWYLVFVCHACGKRKLWKTAWGMRPNIRCHQDTMDRETAVPAGCLFVHSEESGQSRVVIGVDGAGEDSDMSVYVWIDENGEFVSEQIGHPPEDVLVILDERCQSSW